MKFIVFNPDTGQILRTGNCQPMDVPLQAGPGEVSMEDSSEEIVRDTTHTVRLAFGVPIPLPTEA